MSEIPDTISPVRKRRLPSAGWRLEQFRIAYSKRQAVFAD